MNQLSASAARTWARRSWEITLSLALAELRDRYGRGRSRLIKWLLDPFAVSGVYLGFVIFIVDRGGDAPGLSVACAVVPFQLFTMAVFNSLMVVRDRRSLIQNMGFSRNLIPAGVGVAEIVGFAASLSLLALMMAIYGVAPSVQVLWLPAVLATTVAFGIACTYPAALFGVWFRELVPFARSAVRVFFFLAPGVVALSQMPSGVARDLVWLNPLTGIFEGYRDVLMYGQAPGAWEIAYPLGFSALLFAVFLPIFRSEQRHLAKVA
jgi:ABC-type polysaccharide/polyol phosphate export permease